MGPPGMEGSTLDQNYGVLPLSDRRTEPDVHVCEKEQSFASLDLVITHEPMST
jgi:hypothetical protein